MWRGLGACVAIVALLSGFEAAPYTHAHHGIDARGDEHHPHGETLIHAHATPHEPGPAHTDDHGRADRPDDEERSPEQIWSVDTFVCHQPVAAHPPVPVLLPVSNTDVHLTSVWLGGARPEPSAHGPPIIYPSSLRAPPPFPPTLA